MKPFSRATRVFWFRNSKKLRKLMWVLYFLFHCWERPNDDCSFVLLSSSVEARSCDLDIWIGINQSLMKFCRFIFASESLVPAYLICTTLSTVTKRHQLRSQGLFHSLERGRKRRWEQRCQVTWHDSSTWRCIFYGASKRSITRVNYLFERPFSPLRFS